MFKVDLEKRRQEILYGSILKTLLILSVPTIMMGIVQSLIPFSDAFFANKYLGNKIFAAISYSQPAINTMTSLSQGLAVVAMAMIGQVAGRGDVDRVKKMSTQIFMWGLILGILLIPVVYLLSNIISNTATEDMRYNIYLYMSLNSIIIPFLFIASIFNAIKNVTGNPEASFYRMLILFLLKLIFNYIYLKIMNLGIKGTMLSSLSAYIITGVWMYYDLFVKDSLYKMSLKNYKLEIPLIKEVMILGIPSMITYSMINLGFVLINLEVVKYGVVAVSALGIASQINNLCFVLPSCIGTSLTTMVSMNIGSEQVLKAKKSYIYSIIVSLVISFFMLTILLSCDKLFISFFTNNDDIIKIAKDALETYTYSIFPFGIFTLGQAVLNALGRTKIPLFVGILRIWLIRYLFIIVTQAYLGYFSIFYGNLVSNTIAAIVMVIIVSKIEWKPVVKFKKGKRK